MPKEYFDPVSRKIFKVHSFDIKPVQSRFIFYNYLGELVKRYCASCNKEIKYGEYHFKGYKNRFNKIAIRKTCAYSHVCFDCGMNVLKEITPKKLLNRFNNKLLEVS